MSKRAASRCRAGDVGELSALQLPDSHPPGQRAVGQDAHAVPPGRGEDVELDAADQHGVRRLLGAEALEAPLACRPLRLDDLAGGE